MFLLAFKPELYLNIVYFNLNKEPFDLQTGNIAKRIPLHPLAHTYATQHFHSHGLHYSILCLSAHLVQMIQKLVC